MRKSRISLPVTAFVALMPAISMPATLVTLGVGAIATSTLTREAVAQEGDSSSRSNLWNKIAGNWTQFKGQVREQWGALTDDDLMEIQGQRQQLVGKIQARYGISLEEADAQVRQWENKIAP